jgi:hypothetical protein
MAQRKGISTGTTAQRSIEEQGKLRFNTTTNLLEYYDGTSWKSIDAPPVVSSVSPSNLLSGDGTGNYTIVVTGSGFSSTVTALLIADDGTEISPDTVTRDSVSQATLVVAKNKANLTNANEPFDVKITNSSGLAGTLADALNIDAQPAFSTAAGSLGTFSHGNRTGISVSAVAADPESGGDITYTLESGSLPAGLSLTSTSSGAVISGDADAVGSNTTSTFTIRAADVNSNVNDRQFTITVNAPVIQSFTSSGTYSVPSGITAVDVLVVAGGGGGGTSYHGGGGGAGGLIYRPGFPVTPGGTVTVTVGDGGNSPHPNYPGPETVGVVGGKGQDSVFGTLTAKGGGAGGTYAGQNPGPDLSGGSGGGNGQGSCASTFYPAAGSATQPTQPGDSGTYGFGNVGGGAYGDPWSPGGGGGGAGAVGSNGNPGPMQAGPASGSQGGAGGIGKAYTIADGTTSVYYAGGGGGSGSESSNLAAYPAGGQGGGGDGGVGGTGGPIPGTHPGSPNPNHPGQAGIGGYGTANRGGGGGAGERVGGSNPGGSGGKGVVIVSY